MADDEKPWQAALSPELIARLEAHERREMLHELPLSRESTRPPIKLHVEPDGWSYSRIGSEPRERERLESFTHELRQLTPQALLRDLHRPVHEVVVPHFEPRGEAVDFGGTAALKEAKAAGRFERAAPLPSLLQAVREEQARRRKWLRVPWQPYYRDDEEHPPVAVARWE